MDACDYLEYRDGEFEAPRAYCTAVDRFVQPMRADVCNCRYRLRPARDCEYYVDAEGLDPLDPLGECTDGEETGGADGGTDP